MEIIVEKLHFHGYEYYSCKNEWVNDNNHRYGGYYKRKEVKNKEPKIIIDFEAKVDVELRLNGLYFDGENYFVAVTKYMIRNYHNAVKDFRIPKTLVFMGVMGVMGGYVNQKESVVKDSDYIINNNPRIKEFLQYAFSRELSSATKMGEGIDGLWLNNRSQYGVGANLRMEEYTETSKKDGSVIIRVGVFLYNYDKKVKEIKSYGEPLSDKVSKDVSLNRCYYKLIVGVFLFGIKQEFGLNFE